MAQVLTAEQQARSLEMADERVLAGSELLDGFLPGWDATIATEILDLASCTECVLGQLYRDFQKAPSYARVNACRFGFLSTCLVSPEMLTAAWKRLILGRREHNSLPA